MPLEKAELYSAESGGEPDERVKPTIHRDKAADAEPNGPILTNCYPFNQIGNDAQASMYCAASGALETG